MKLEKLKKIILYTSMLYSIVIVISMSITYFKMNTSIRLEVNESEVKETLDKYKTEAESITNEECKSTILSLVNFVMSNNKSGERILKEYYSEILDSNENILNYYSKVREKCPNLSDELMKKYDLPLLYLTSSIQNDEILQKYMFQYELSLRDYGSRSVGEASLISIENNIKTKSELNIIRNTIKAIKEVE